MKESSDEIIDGEPLLVGDDVVYGFSEKVPRPWMVVRNGQAVYGLSVFAPVRGDREHRDSIEVTREAYVDVLATLALILPARISGELDRIDLGWVLEGVQEIVEKLK